MNKARILIVEDEAISAMEIENELQGLGYEVTSIVDTGEKAIEKAGEDQPDLIMMDIRIKGEMDGIDTAEEIRHQFGIPVIFSTAYLDEERIERAKVTMPFGYILKPIQEKDLKVTIEMALYVSKIDKERENAEKELQKREENLRTTLKSIGDAVISTDTTGLITGLNLVAEKLTGWKSREVVNKPLTEVFNIINAQTRENVEDPVKKVLKKGEVVGLDNHTVLISKDGTERQIADSAAPIIDNKGDVTGVVLVFRDVTEEYRIREKLQENEEKFSIAFRSVPGSITITTVNEGRYIEVNDGFVHLTGYEREEVIGKTAFDVNIWADTVQRDKLLKVLREDGFVHDIECTFNKKYGEYFIGLASAEIITIQAVQYLILIVIDITERKKAEQALKKSEKRFRQLAENIKEVFWIVSPDWKQVYYVSPAIREVWQISEEELYRNTLLWIDSIVLEDRKRVVAYLSQKQQGDLSEMVFPEFRILRPDGSERWILIRGFPVYDANGQIERVAGIAEDITERKKTQEIMIQSEKMMSLGGLTAGVAHELNNPLGGMLQGVQNVQRRLSPDLKRNQLASMEVGIDLHKLQSYLEKREITSMLDGIKDSGKKATRIISNMLQFSRKSEFNMAPTNLVILIENVLNLASKDYNLKKNYDFRNIKIVKEFDSNLPIVPCTETELEQVLLNLLSNAAWAMVNDNNDRLPQITLRLKLEDEVARIEVEDNGPGIDEETRKRIFEPFFTTKPVGEGTGLGLSVSYMIITNNHKGTMEVDSELGKGTIFTIKLPLEREKAS